MVTLRDLPLIVDDLCFSAGKSTERRRTEMAAQLLREAVNSAHISKLSPDRKKIELDCSNAQLLRFALGL